jgi:type II secretory pathway pseudopilin PulG
MDPYPRTDSSSSQSGAALLIFALLLILGLLSAFFGQLNSASQTAQRDQITNDALAQAKQALIGYAASVQLNPTRPGDLPCPDNHSPGSILEGTPSTPCNGNALGRLPWKTLGLPDLRDGSGERLWYAVSINFKNSTRTTCSPPGQVGCLNSDTLGTITVRNSNGTIINNGTNSTAAIAVIIAPGGTLTRQDGVNQVRDSANAITAINYLDIGNGEDNAVFINSDTDGFINGIVRDASNNTIVNDRVLAITTDNLIPVLEQRVAGEVLICLTEYAKKTQNLGRYPWAAPLNAGAAPSYVDTSGNRFGRIPDTPFSATKTDSGTIMDDSWTACNINSTTGWWLNWKEHVFYAVADAYKPAATVPTCGLTVTCLVVSPPSATTNKKAVVFVAGRRLAAVAGGQPRVSNSDKGTIANYLEDQNATPADDIFTKATYSTIFNDYVLHQ